MPSSGTDNGATLAQPPPISPRFSPLQPHSERTNGQEHVEIPYDTEGINSGSDGEKERVREKLKKTSIAGIRFDNQPTESDLRDNHLPAEPAETPQGGDTNMGGSEDRSELSDSSQGSRKRSRDPDDDGDDPSDPSNDVRSRACTRKRSRELSDEPEGKSNREGTPASKSDDMSMTQSPSGISGKRMGGITTPPRVSMDEDTFASPSRRLDGRKRAREEGDVYASEDKTKTKKPWVEEDKGESGKKETSTGESAGNRGSGNALSSPTSVTSRQGTPIDLAKSLTPEPAKIPPGSGFSNTSAQSPFATAAGVQSIFGGASTGTLFASSTKFGPMSSSSASPFATLASTSGSLSPFGSPKPSSPFATAGSGGQGGLGAFSGNFGSFVQKAPTSGFGALAAKGGNVISSAPKALQPIGALKPARPFGAPEDYSDEEGSDEEGDDDESGDDEKTRKEKESKTPKDEIFQETEVVTGEENEVMICHYRAKSYHYDKSVSAWKERGVGTLKLLATKLDLNDLSANPEVSLKRKYRLVMRADAVHKVILNVPLSKELVRTYGDQGKPPSGNNFRLLGLENEELVTLLIKLKNPTDSRALYTHILECLLGPEDSAPLAEEWAV